jgi:hypothetical protein
MNSINPLRRLLFFRFDRQLQTVRGRLSPVQIRDRWNEITSAGRLLNIKMLSKRGHGSASAATEPAKSSFLERPHHLADGCILPMHVAYREIPSALPASVGAMPGFPHPAIVSFPAAERVFSLS